MEASDLLWIIVVGFFMLVLLFTGLKSKAKLFLFLTTVSVFLIGFMDNFWIENRIAAILYDWLQLVMGPTLYIYIVTVRGSHAKRSENILHSIVPVSVLVFQIIVVLQMPNEEVYYDSIAYRVVQLITLVTVMVYGVLMLIASYRHKWKDRGELTNEVKWSNTLIFAYCRNYNH